MAEQAPAIPALTAEEIAALNANVDIMDQDVNGDAVFSNERALFGYIEEHEKLVICALPATMTPPLNDVLPLGSTNYISTVIGTNGDAHRTAHRYLPETPAATRALLTKKLFVLNFNRLVAHGLEANRAGLIAILRARWVVLGCLFRELAARGTTYDEVVVDNGPVATAATAQALATVADAIIALRWLAANAELVKWAIRYAENIWAATEFMFRVRNHHYREDLVPMYNRVWRAISENNEAWPENIQIVDAVRTAIHPFGVKALPIMAAHFIAHGKVGNGIIKRWNGAPNGVAFFTTAHAAVMAMSTEAWYGTFYSKYSELVDGVTEVSRQILNNRYGFHLSSGLYGVPTVRTVNWKGTPISLDEAEAKVSGLAPVLQGFISWVKSYSTQVGAGAFSLGDAKVLEKRAATNPSVNARIQAMLDATINVITEAKDVPTAVQNAFPSVQTVAATPATPAAPANPTA